MSVSRQTKQKEIPRDWKDEFQKLREEHLALKAIVNEKEDMIRK